MPRSDSVAPPTTTPRPAYTPDEVAELLRINLRTVRRYIDDGRIRTTRVGKLRRISADEVDRLMREGVK